MKTAFLCGSLNEELYIELPEGCVTPGQEGKVGSLGHPIYGLIQSAYNFNETFDGYIVKYDLIRSNSDPCLYYHHDQNVDDITLFGIWVDDGEYWQQRRKRKPSQSSSTWSNFSR